MATASEREPSRSEIDEQALQEVDQYVERVEKQMETKKPVGPLKPSAVQVSAPVVHDDSGNVVMQAGQKKEAVKIVLPLDEEEVREGLHHKVFDAVRWLAEWCVLMIKKYPGKVFYKHD
jgi:hypothetical protein